MVAVSRHMFRAFARLTRPARRRVDISYIYHYDLTRPLPEARAEIPVEITRATPDDVDAAVKVAGRPVNRLEDGLACFVASVDGRFAAWNWTRFRSGDDEGNTIHLGPGEIYTFDAYTVEEFRGRKIHGATLAYMLRTAAEDGCTGAWTMASALNRRSWKTMSRIGWRLSGCVLRIRFGGRRVVIRLSGSARPLCNV